MMTVRDLRAALDDLPDTAPVCVQTIVGGDLVHDDTALLAVEVVTDRDGYLLRLVPDDADPYRTRALIDLGLAVREAAASTPPRC
ncbi:hypothetical protein Pam4_64 [Pseudanabaena phage Pam4]|nr:hypothetical protein Pam4_64 [Pseudanabaena phage Pam4]